MKQANQGYLMNPNDTSNCGYCPYASGAEYLKTLDISPDQKWRNFGIFLVFCFTNWALVYFFVYTVLVKGWTFGFGPLFNAVGKAVGAVKGVFKRSPKAEQTAA